ncbi:MAG: hypothetical protein Q7T33_04350 [Dehalococcoidia bacterium]|nr:hypothetical protein [Dehalococcoidia bacterium]
MRTGTNLRRRYGSPARARAAGLAIMLAACSALLLAACGGDDSAKSSPTAASGAPATSSAAASVSPSTPGAPSPSGGPATTAAGTPSGDMTCILISKQEAEAALGEPLGNAQTGSFQGTISCGYQPSSDRGVLISITSGVAKADFESLVNQAAALLQRTPQAVPGVGDEAFWLEPYLSVLKKDVYFRLTVFSPDITGQIQLERESDLARKAAARVP